MYIYIYICCSSQALVKMGLVSEVKFPRVHGTIQKANPDEIFPGNILVEKSAIAQSGAGVLVAGACADCWLLIADCWCWCCHVTRYFTRWGVSVKGSQMRADKRRPSTHDAQTNQYIYIYIYMYSLLLLSCLVIRIIVIIRCTIIYIYI